MKKLIFILILFFQAFVFAQNGNPTPRRNGTSYPNATEVTQADTIPILFGLDHRLKKYILANNLFAQHGITSGSSDGYINGVSFSNNLLTFTRQGADAFSGSVDLSSLAGGSGLQNIVEDLSPELGDNLDVAGNIIFDASLLRFDVNTIGGDDGFQIYQNGNIYFKLNNESITIGNQNQAAGSLRLFSNNTTGGAFIQLDNGNGENTNIATYSITADDDFKIFGNAGLNGDILNPAFRIRSSDLGISFKNYDFPIADGTAGQVLKTDGLGNLTWQNDSGGVGGAVDSVQGQTGVVNLVTDDIPDSVAFRYTNDSDITRLSTTNGTNTGDETTSTIQTKRPLKTINGETLEGIGDIAIAGGDTSVAQLIYVDNNADLESINVAPTDGQRYFRQGFYDLYDGGQHHFIWDATSTATEIPGIIINPPAIATGRFIALNSNDLDLRDLGAFQDANDDTLLFKAAMDHFVALGYGRLSIKDDYSGFRYLITENETTSIRNYSNILIEGNGKIFVDSVNPNDNVVQGRGVLFRLSEGTKNFKVIGLDILIDEGNATNEPSDRGVICSSEGDIENLYFEDLIIKSEVRPDNQVGSHGITFFSDTADDTDIKVIKNLNIKNCYIELYGKSIYGVHLKRTVIGGRINVKGLLHANSSEADDSYNFVGVYGDSKNVSVYDSEGRGAGHGQFAASMSANVTFRNCYSANVGVVGEAGFEVEYKGSGTGVNYTGHGSPDFQPNNVRFINCTAENNYNNFVVREEGDSPNSKAPYNVVIENCTALNAINNNLLIGSVITGASDLTSVITGIKISDSWFEGSGNTNIRIYDPKDVDFYGNDVIGGTTNLTIGRTTNIYPTGDLNFYNNRFKNATNQSVLVESLGGLLTFNHNKIYNPGSRAFQFTLSGGALANAQLDINYNRAYGNGTSTAEGFYIGNNRTALLGSNYTFNYTEGFASRGHRIQLDESNVVYNTSKDCPTADQYVGTNSQLTPNNDN